MVITITVNASMDKTAIINNFQTGKINRLDKPLETAGGKGLNVTRALKTLNKEVISTGFLGGYIGEQLKMLMNEEGIKNDFFEIKDNSRICLAILDQEKNTITELNENGPIITKEELKLFYERLDTLCKNAKIAIISGSVPKSLGNNIYHDLIKFTKERGLITGLDAKEEPLRRGIEAKPYFIKVNKTEAEGILDFKLNTKDNLLKGVQYILNYCNVAVITLEDKGCLIANKDEVYSLTPPEIKRVNSVGSGDSFFAGLIYAFIENKPLKDMGIWGIATGTANALTDRAGLCNINDIYELIPKVLVEKIL